MLGRGASSRLQGRIQRSPGIGTRFSSKRRFDTCSIGVAIGATLGARYQSKFKKLTLRRILCAVAIFAGVELVLSLFNITCGNQRLIGY